MLDKIVKIYIVSNEEYLPQPVARKETAMRMMYSLVASVFVFGLLAIAAPSTGVADKPVDVTAFKQYLVKNSTWNAEWKNGSYNGTFKLRFAIAKGGGITGKLFESSGGNPDGPLHKVKIYNNQCVSFTSDSDTEYDYCLEEGGTLTGTQLFTNGIGESFEGKTTALPKGS